MTDFYALLEVSTNASEVEIKKSWSRLVRLHPPDQDPETNHLLNEARKVLSDPRARADYDAEIAYGKEIAELFQLGYASIAEEEYEDAIQSFKEIIALHPGSLRGRNMLALAYAYDEQFPEAVHHLSKVNALAPESALYASNLGSVYEKWALSSGEASRGASAEEWFKRAIELEPFNSAHYLELFGIYMKQRRYDDAEAAIEGAVSADGEEDGQDVDTLLNLLWVYMLSDQQSKIVLVAERIAEVIGDDEESQSYVVSSFLKIAIERSEKRFFQDAYYLAMAARKISAELGELSDIADDVIRYAVVEKQAEECAEQTAIEPRAVAFLCGQLAYRDLGFTVDDKLVNSVCETVASWSNAEVRSAVSKCRTTYPELCTQISRLLPDIESMGSRSEVTSKPSSSSCCSVSGCIWCIGIVLFLLYVMSR